MSEHDSSSLEQGQEISARILELNEQLSEESAALAARAFNLGCLLSGLVVGVVVTVAWLLSHWVTAFVVLIITVLLGISLAALLAMRARYNNMVRIYQESTQPHIQAMLVDFDLTPEVWQQIAGEVLAEKDPLVLMLETFPLEGNRHE